MCGVSASEAQGVRELFATIQRLRDEQAEAGDDDDDGEEGEEEMGEDDEMVEEESEGYETDDSMKAGEAEDTCSSEAKSSKARSGAKDDGAVAEDDGAVAKDHGGGVGEVRLDSQEDAQAPKKPCWRYRSKSSLSTLPSTAVLGASPAVETPASYVGGIPDAQQEELQRLLQQIALEEGGGDMSPEIARHEPLLVRMGTPEQTSKPEGPIRDDSNLP